MKTILKFLSLFIFLLPLYSQQIYKWTDSSGIVHFSDKPQEGAEEVNLPQIQTFTPIIPEFHSDENTVDEEKSLAQSYKKIAITHPEDQITIRNPQGAVSIAVEVTPKLKRQDKLQLILDEVAVGNPQSANVFNLQGINRGTHTVAAEIVNPKGKVLLKSNTITIYMKQPWAGMGKNAP